LDTEMRITRDRRKSKMRMEVFNSASGLLALYTKGGKKT